MHRVDHAQLGQTGMRDLLGHEMTWDDTDDFSTALEYGVGQDSHQADVRASVDQGQFTRDHCPGKAACSRGIFVEPAGARPGEDADAFHSLVQSGRSSYVTDVLRGRDPRASVALSLLVPSL